MKLHTLVNRGTVRHSDTEERLGEVCVQRHRVRDLQCLYNRDAVFTARYGLHFHNIQGNFQLERPQHIINRSEVWNLSC
jgi:hypothetical protein